MAAKNPKNAKGTREMKPRQTTRPCSFLYFFASFAFFAAIILTSNPAPAQQRSSAINFTRDGQINYAKDDRGNQIPDFSHAGYAGGGVAVPDAPVAVFVPARDDDQTLRLQAAIDYVSSLKPQSNGLRGTVLLGKGTFRVGGALYIRTSGIVLRGSGQETILLAAGRDRRTLVSISGASDRTIGPQLQLPDEYIPVGSRRLRLRTDHELKVNDTILITRPSTPEWIKQLNMDDMGGDRHGFSWRPGSRDVVWDRTVTAVDGETVTLDAPITLAIDPALGGGTVAKYAWPGRISHVGVENLRLESENDRNNPQDEDHAWMAIVIEHARDVWVRQVNFAHFAGSAVCAWETVSRLTVEDCKYLDPISEPGGWRRNAFFTAGQQCLYQRCFAEQSAHAFATGFCSAGPNAFVQCEAIESQGDSGPIDSVSCGVLFDNVKIDGNAIALVDRQYRAQGAGWSAFNCVLWNCAAGVIRNQRPPGAQNWAFGSRGEFEGLGHWEGSADPIDPLSLYVAQLSARLGRNGIHDTGFMNWSTDASSSPTPEKAAELITASTQPAATIEKWIDRAADRSPIPNDATGVKSIDDLWQPGPSPEPPVLKTLAIVNGRLMVGDQPLKGKRQETQWWRGSMRPGAQDRPAPAITRFAPGRTGLGFTDDLHEVAADMRKSGAVAFDHHYGLWYDRRRDDHQRVRRMTPDVAPPFYELPFRRSGQGKAYDGLSLYDLTRFNPWYWDRLRQFASICDQEGLVLIQQHYFQHNILEAGAHYADFPWRSANNINDTGFPEPPPYAGDKRIFMAEQFYDVSNPKRRELHRDYIRKCLDNFAGSSNVIHMTAEEFTGPLPFVQFWLDTIGEYQRETGRDVFVALSTTKDVQDAILADPERSKLVDVIDIRYWWYQETGDLYAPPGGENLAPRQWVRVLKPKNPNREQAARAIREYRQKYSEKAVTWSVDLVPGLDWTSSFVE